MSFQAMITGKLTRPPQTKTSKNGNPYVWMLSSVPTEQERLPLYWVSMIAWLKSWVS